MDYSYTIWIPLIMLISFLVTGLLGGKMKSSVSGIIGTASIFTAMILSYKTAYSYFLGGSESFESIIAYSVDWLPFTENLVVRLGVILDPISVMMLVVVTTISTMVHLYSIGYMHGDQGYAKFFSYLSLFSFSMLGLVVATNIFQMYIAWELVGASSYLLISFYYTKPSAVAASKKAFIVTRFADLGFLLGILLLSFYTETFDFQELMQAESIEKITGVVGTFMGMSIGTLALTLIFMGGAGKSAMFPLHIWLPDAMEGPTPVSALIHAATMVVAGVFLVARMFPIFAAVGVLDIVAFVGAFSSLIAAVIACTQVDIKRILAFSTMSQIGYMMLSLGVCGAQAEEIAGGQAVLGFTASMFHLFTHAMFKALLFLGAGSIIHAVHSNNWTDMGGLRKYLPITHATFFIACLAIAGIPLLSGFFSKDEILAAARMNNTAYYVVETFVAFLTAFYMFRLYYLVFWNKDRVYEHTPKESPFTMTIPLIILAAAAIFAGYIPFGSFVSSNGAPFHPDHDYFVMVVSSLCAIAGIVLARFMYKKESDRADNMAAQFGSLFKWAYNKFYMDEVYLFITHKIIFDKISNGVAVFDRKIIDGSMDGIAALVNFTSNKIKGAQSGQLQQYLIVFVGGAIALAFMILYLIEK